MNKPPRTPSRKVREDRLDYSTHQEDPSEPDAEALREAGFDLLPINGGDREVQD